MSRKTAVRQGKIRQILLEQKEIRTADLARMLQVTPETIRKDLDELEEQDVIVREHGKAILKTALTEPPIQVRSLENFASKEKIAFEAISRIKDGEMVFIDTSSTLMAGIQMLRSKRELTIVTNSIDAALESLQMGFEVYLLGGRLTAAARCTSGPTTLDELSQFHIDTALLGTTGIRDLDSFSVFSLEGAAIKKKIIEQSSNVIVVMEPSKFELSSHYPFLKFSQTPLLITNPLNDEQKEKLKDVQNIVEV